MKITDILEKIYVRLEYSYKKVPQLIGRLSDAKTLKRLYLTLGLPLLVLIVILAGVKYKDNQNSQLQKEIDQAVQESRNLLYQDNPEAAQALLDETLNKANTSRQKAEIYLEKASIAFNANKADETIQFAHESIKLNESHGAYALIGYAAKQKGDWQLAADSFAKAKNLTEKTDDPTLNTPYNDYRILEEEARSKI